MNVHEKKCLKFFEYFQTAIRSQLFANIGWNVLGNMSAKAIGPIFSILVARLLMPSDYGVFGVAMACMVLLNLVKDMGISQAIIVNQEEDDWRSIQFTVQLFVAIILYPLIFLTFAIIKRKFFLIIRFFS